MLALQLVVQTHSAHVAVERLTNIRPAKHKTYKLIGEKNPCDIVLRCRGKRTVGCAHKPSAFAVMINKRSHENKTLSSCSGTVPGRAQEPSPPTRSTKPPQATRTHRQMPHFSQCPGSMSFPAMCLQIAQKYSACITPQSGLLQYWLFSPI